MKKIALLLPLLFAGCATPSIQLNEVAASVRFVEYMTPKEKAEYEEVGQVKCEEGMNGKMQSANITSCQNNLKNEAAKMGAEVVLMDKDKDWWQGSYGSGCDNCVKGKGLAFKKKK